ncbi:MAG: hypothetical protein WCO23_02770 [bacterium]
MDGKSIEQPIDIIDSAKEIEDDNFDKFKPTPPEWQPVRQQFVQMIKNNKYPDFMGITENSENYRVFHGTTAEKLALIVESGGMKPFLEKESSDPAIFYVTTPTMAIWHAAENGPHDTLRKEGKIQYSHDKNQVVLLLIEIPKDDLENNPEATKMHQATGVQEIIFERKGFPNPYNKLYFFKKSPKEDYEEYISKGKDVDEFGWMFPTSSIPNKYIYVIDSQNRRMPIEEYVREMV